MPMFFHIFTPTAPAATARSTSRTVSSPQVGDWKSSTENVVAKATRPG